MNISGVLVRSHPEHIDTISARLMGIDGVEVHGANPDGRMVVTVETTHDHTMADTVVSIQNLPGVISASVIYHQQDDSDPVTDL